MASFSSFDQCYAVASNRMILLRLQQLILLVFVTYTIALATVWSNLLQCNSLWTLTCLSSIHLLHKAWYPADRAMITALHWKMMSTT
ncbi:unnamed protein product [Cylicocyclus nassatus]|uniref:Uncharacterized protein n=1 Tax=Cylicocyclus nassatus TaxID=53992 RepID=A0AA36H3B9_CYLNA|nr:unnamed protein product [Cylicocyclus nassatus]